MTYLTVTYCDKCRKRISNLDSNLKKECCDRKPEDYFKAKIYPIERKNLEKELIK